MAARLSAHVSNVSELGRSALELLGAARCQLTPTMLVDALKGSETKAMRQKGLPELPGFKGGRAQFKKVEVERVLKLMIVPGYVRELLVADENFSGINAYLQLGPNAAALRQGRTPLLAPSATREVPETSGLEIEGGEGVGADAGAGESGTALGGGGGVDELLFDELRTLRKSLAEKGQAVFTIWPDKVQKEIVNVLPFSDSQLKAIHGIGKNKAERFGPAILGLIRAFMQRHPELLPHARANMEAAEKEEQEKRALTLAQMRDPVVASDGHSYERRAIEEVR
jgi:superfamily II DNA helicase RecQ